MLNQTVALTFFQVKKMYNTHSIDYIYMLYTSKLDQLCSVQNQLKKLKLTESNVP